MLKHACALASQVDLIHSSVENVDHLVLASHHANPSRAEPLHNILRNCRDQPVVLVHLERHVVLAKLINSCQPQNSRRRELILAECRMPRSRQHWQSKLDSLIDCSFRSAIFCFSFLFLRWGCREHFVSGCWHSSGRDCGRYSRECWLSTLGVLHPGVPVMWHAHIRDLFTTAEGCERSRLPNVTRLHWACVSAGVRQ